MLRIKMMWVLLICLPFWATAQKAAPKNIPVNVSVTIEDKVDDKNLILFSYDRPLIVADFKGRPDASSHGVAATYSGIQVAMKGAIRDNKMQLDVLLTVYFDKSKSWAKKDGKSERVLAHEQNHFDLTALKACELSKAIASANYKSETAMQQIRDLQQKYTKELNELQVQYDRETKHGTIEEEQAKWSARIKSDLAAVGCY